MILLWVRGSFQLTIQLIGQEAKLSPFPTMHPTQVAPSHQDLQTLWKAILENVFWKTIFSQLSVRLWYIWCICTGETSLTLNHLKVVTKSKHESRCKTNRNWIREIVHEFSYTAMSIVRCVLDHTVNFVICLEALSLQNIKQWESKMAL